MIRTVLATAALLAAAPALAHPSIVKVTPGANATVAAPREIRILFSEAVMAPLSGIALADAAGKPVATGKASVAQADAS